LKNWEEKENGRREKGNTAASFCFLAGQFPRRLESGGERGREGGKARGKRRGGPSGVVLWPEVVATIVKERTQC